MADDNPIAEWLFRSYDVLWTAAGRLESQVVRNPDLPAGYRDDVSAAFAALREGLAVARQYGLTGAGPVPLFGAERSPHWSAVRAAYLKKNPSCAACGCDDAVEVHHVHPVSWPGGKDLELDESNLMTLCRVHHLWVGHLGSFFSKNDDARADAAAFLAKVRARPLPPAADPPRSEEFGGPVDEKARTDAAGGVAGGVAGGPAAAGRDDLGPVDGGAGGEPKRLPE